MSGQAYIFDLLSDASVLSEGKLKKILESEEIVKVRFFFIWKAINSMIWCYHLEGLLIYTSQRKFFPSNSLKLNFYFPMKNSNRNALLNKI